MMTPARLLFGARTNAEVTLSIAVDGAPLAAPPPLWIYSGGGQPRAIPGTGTGWTAVLPPGDHAVFLPVDVDKHSWFLAPLAFTLSAPVTIVIGGELCGQQLVAWSAGVGVAADPKNPWPPPQASPLSYELVEGDWLLQTLQELYAKISPQRVLTELRLGGGRESAAAAEPARWRGAPSS